MTSLPRILVLIASAFVLTGAIASGASGGPAQPVAAPEPAAAAPAPREPAPPTRPNIVFVVTDDLSWNLVRFMPEVKRMQRSGATFSRYFVTSSLCCPSRATILTGRYPHNTGVVRNTPPHGGYQAFERRVEHATFVPHLKRAGYRTAYLGKFLNGFAAKRDRPPPHWDLWFANGRGYRNHDYDLLERDVTRKGRAGSRDGRVLHFGRRPRDYLVDVIRRRGNRFIRAAGRKPFFIAFSTFTPHLPTVPAKRHRRRFKRLPVPRSAAFNVRTANPPRWLAQHPRLSMRRLTRIRREWRRRARSVLSIDELLRSVRRNLEAQGIARRTYVVFTYDNGYHHGEHRHVAGKRTAYDHDIRVPLIVAGPGIAPRAEIDEMAANIDLAPTFVRMAGGRPPPRTDGMSLLPLLRGVPAPWRDEVLIEYRRPSHRGYLDPDATDEFVRSPPRYDALRTADGLYVEHGTGEREYYDHATDPFELSNRYSWLRLGERVRLRRSLRQLRRCAGIGCRSRSAP